MSLFRPVFHDKAIAPDTLERSASAVRVRRFSIGLTIGFIVVGNALFLAALWASGLDLDKIFAERDLFDPVRDVCLRMAWYTPQGQRDPVRLCKEWINLADASGNVHKFEKSLSLTKESDGKVYAHFSNAGDGRILVLMLLVVAIVGSGMWLQRYLIARYRARVAAPPQDP
jgi:hypothetical protein